MKLNNQYFILRHGQTTQQIKRKDFIYNWPDEPPVKLTKRGINQIKKAARKLKEEGIDLIFSSDIYRTRQTVEIVAKNLGLKINPVRKRSLLNGVNFDRRLRDINLGIYHGRLKREFFEDFPLASKKFSQRPKKGESWNDVKKRLKAFLKDIDKKNKNKKILIVSHGDPLWLLEGTIKGLSNKELLKEIFKGHYIKVGELRKIYAP